MTYCYVDSSAVLRYVLAQPEHLDLVSLAGTVMSSVLAMVESLRILDRLRLLGQTPEEDLIRRRESLQAFRKKLLVLDLVRPILARAAGPLEAPLGTLDAIHLATALLWRENNGHDLALATHDRELARAARLYGLQVIGATG